MTFLEAKTNLCNSKLNIDYDDVVSGDNDLFSVQDINDAINFGAKRTWDYKPWTFTQKAKTLTIPTPIPEYYDYPNDFEDNSVSFITVNGVPWNHPTQGKRNFGDYQRWRSDFPNDTAKIWAEYDRFIFANPAAVVVGQAMDVFGKLRAPTLSADADLLPFSPMDDNDENSGNQAIIGLAYAYLLSSEKKKNPTQAVAEEKRALTILDLVWTPMAERRAQENSQNRPFFSVRDNYRGGGRSGRYGGYPNNCA